MEAYRCSFVEPNLPKTFPSFSLALLVSMIVGLIVLEKYFDIREITIFCQISPLSLLPYSKEIIAFFP